MNVFLIIISLSVSLLAGEVKCQDVTTEAPIVTTVINTVDKVQSGVTSGPTAAPDVTKNTTPEEAPKPGRTVVVTGCGVVGKEDVSESNAVKVFLSTTDCETTKRIIQENPARWCSKDNCDLKIFQEGNTALVSSEDADLATLADALKSEHLKEKLGVTKIETPSSSGSSVFVGILVSGLLAAVAITVGYLKCPRRTSGKGVRLAEGRRNPGETQHQRRKPPRPKSQTNPPHPPTVTPPPRLQDTELVKTTTPTTHTQTHTHTHTHTNSLSDHNKRGDQNDTKLFDLN
ncbi:hypothetical protein KUCAC02_020383 [Chaenocephalus aceratus]|nr:hypothetical protein KUCAC02_020383 [Chaenocephalus aceratus]